MDLTPAADDPHKLIVLHKKSGRIELVTESEETAWKLRNLLLNRYRFRRFGLRVLIMPDDAILPSFIRWHLWIRCGWLDWYGFHFRSANRWTDRFLLELAREHFPEAAHKEASA